MLLKPASFKEKGLIFFLVGRSLEGLIFNSRFAPREVESRWAGTGTQLYFTDPNDRWRQGKGLGFHTFPVFQPPWFNFSFQYKWTQNRLDRPKQG